VMENTLSFFHEASWALLKASKVGLLLFLALPYLGVFPFGALLGLQTLMLVVWAAIVFFAFAQYSLKTMVMVVFAEGFFIACARCDVAVFAPAGLVLAVVFPLVLALVTVFVHDPVLRKRLVRGGRRRLLS